jgi:hypothetical protein
MDDRRCSDLQGHNFATVDLFDVEHAEKGAGEVRAGIRQTASAIRQADRRAQSFVRRRTSGLAQDGKVVSVRLALFSEMVKGKPWVPADTGRSRWHRRHGRQLSGRDVQFPQANPKHRLHQQAAREVLKSLLPEVGSDIKGHMRSHSELLEASGYQNVRASSRSAQDSGRRTAADHAHGSGRRTDRIGE